MNESPPDDRLTPLLNQVHTNHDESYVAPPPEPSVSQQEEDVLDPTNPQASTSTTVTSNPSDDQNEEIDHLQLPTLTSYCSFINYGLTFGKWLLVVCVVNIVTVFVLPFFLVVPYLFYPWAIVWFLTSAWFFWSAKVVERDLKCIDRIAQYKEGRQTDEEETNGGDQNEASSNNHFDLNYDNIYGRVSRRIDKAWSSNSTTSPLEPSSTLAVSSLVNFAYIFWALFAATSFAAATMVVLTTIYENERSDYGGIYGGIYVLIITCVVLLACSVWMIFREGVPSGIVPFIYVPVAIFCGLTEGHSTTLTAILMTVGTISFHMIIYCGGGSRSCNLSSLTLEMIIWALYSYLTAFLIFDQSSSVYNDHYNPNPRTFAGLYIVLTAFILEHPLLNVVGIILILFSILGMLSDLSNWGEWILITVCGFGLIGVSGFLIKFRRNPRHALNQYFMGRQIWISLFILSLFLIYR